MTEIALLVFTLVNILAVFESALYITVTLHDQQYSHTEHGMCMVLHIAWVLISAIALYVGGEFAAATISVATVWLAILMIGGLLSFANAKSISTAISLSIYTMLLILFLAA